MTDVGITFEVLSTRLESMRGLPAAVPVWQPRMPQQPKRPTQRLLVGLGLLVLAFVAPNALILPIEFEPLSVPRSVALLGGGIGLSGSEW